MADVALNPDFGQPLLSAGDFVAYKQLARTGSFDFIHFDEGMAASGGENVICMDGSLCRQNGQIHLDYTGDGMTDTSFREQNFNLRSLRGNAVLRWEYSPGSQVFLVWQQNRQSRESLGRLDLGRDGRAMLEAPGEHMVMVKINRWFNL